MSNKIPSYTPASEIFAAVVDECDFIKTKSRIYSEKSCEVRLSIAQELSKKTGIPVEKCAEFLADEMMKLLFGEKK